MSHREGISAVCIGYELVFALACMLKNEEFWQARRLIYDGYLGVGDGWFRTGGIEVSDGTGEFDGLGIQLIVDEGIDHNFGIFVDDFNFDNVFTARREKQNGDGDEAIQGAVDAKGFHGGEH
jgi:hypothetical protein